MRSNFVLVNHHKTKIDEDAYFEDVYYYFTCYYMLLFLSNKTNFYI